MELEDNQKKRERERKKKKDQLERDTGVEEDESNNI